MNVHSGRASVAMLRMMGCANGRSARHLLHSDCVVDEKTVVLQKKENEGFGFVLRGAKGGNHLCLCVSSSLHHQLQLFMCSLCPLLSRQSEGCVRACVRECLRGTCR